METTFLKGKTLAPRPSLSCAAGADLKAVVLAVLIFAAKFLERLAIFPAVTASFATEGAI